MLLALVLTLVHIHWLKISCDIKAIVNYYKESVAGNIIIAILHTIIIIIIIIDIYKLNFLTHN